MQLEFTADEVAFRDDVRAFLATSYPTELRAKQDAGMELRQGRLPALAPHRRRKGWSVPAWPVEYGGTGWTATAALHLGRGASRAGTVPIIAFSVNLVGPVIYTFGTPEQKARFLPGIVERQRLVVPGLLRARRRLRPGVAADPGGTREGDHYVVNGQKTWTTLAQHADWGFFLVRTDPSAKQAGRHQLPADRHEEPGRDGAADHHAGRRPRGQRGLARERQGPGREPDPRREPGLDLRQVPAGATSAVASQWCPARRRCSPSCTNSQARFARPAARWPTIASSGASSPTSQST